jgi:protein-S-isoprenylcysteine O-methyltransferase Ste14
MDESTVIKREAEEEYEHLEHMNETEYVDSDDASSEEIDEESSEKNIIKQEIMEKFTQFMVSMKSQWKVNDFINIQKGGTFFYVFLLMVLFQNFNITACVYLSLHGTYGGLWLLKDKIFPDKQWEVPIEIHQACISVVPLLLSFWVSPLLIIKNHVQVNNFRIMLAINSHTIGCVLMMASDTQKYFQLREGRKLITDGWFATSRNINYLGEMMIYFPYALLGNSMWPYVILFCYWYSVFYRNMIKNDMSIKAKEGGLEYIKNTNMLLPYGDEGEIKKLILHHYQIYTFHYICISLFTFLPVYATLSYFFS